MLDVCPVSVEYFPAAHWPLQREAPDSLEYVPASQDLQDHAFVAPFDALLGEYFPASHFTQHEVKSLLLSFE